MNCFDLWPSIVCILHLLSGLVGSSLIRPFFHPCVVISLYSISTLWDICSIQDSIHQSSYFYLFLLLPVISGSLQSLHFHLQLYSISFSLLQHSSPSDLSYHLQSSHFYLIASLSHLCKTICLTISPHLFPLLVHHSQFFHCHLKP